MNDAWLGTRHTERVVATPQGIAGHHTGPIGVIRLVYGVDYNKNEVERTL